MEQGKVYSFLSCINPPSTFAPTALDISNKMQEAFYTQCLHFLKAEKKFHECSKKLENRLASSIQDSVSLDQRIRSRSDQLELISRDLRKLNLNYAQTEDKEEFLRSVCKFASMEQARGVVLSPQIADQNSYLLKLKELDEIWQELKMLNSDIKIIAQIKEQMSTLFVEAVERMIKGNISDNLIRKITFDFADPFLRDQNIAQIFITNLTNHRLNFFRLGLNPLINNINYVQNVTELYEKITNQWVHMLDGQLQIFNRPQSRKQIKNIPRQVMSMLVAEAVPKMERGIYKLKSIVDMSKIRSCLLRLKNKLDTCGQCAWDPLPKLLMKMFVILEEKLDEGAEKLEIAKYNIYSLASYVSIREYLEQIKEARAFDCNKGQTGWERGFKRLSDSRDPTKQPNNKSLAIFNLNIWYLYSHVMKQQGEMLPRADLMIRDNINSITNLNLVTLRKQHDSKALQKLLDLCADVQAVKKILYSEINLLGHQKLRSIVEKQLASKFISDIYTPMLAEHDLKEGLDNAGVVQLSKKQKLNLNKYGKGSENLKILTSDEMKELLS